MTEGWGRGRVRFRLVGIGLKARAVACLAGLAAMVAASAGIGAESRNDFPTAARADYVFACMTVNGQTREALEKCSCSVDVIASLMPYSAYEEAETIMTVRLKGGENAAMFNSVGMLREKVDRLKRAQVEGELRCF
jgi:hypothetical protein